MMYSLVPTQGSAQVKEGQHDEVFPGESIVETCKSNEMVTTQPIKCLVS
jgi:hypothetical protein